MSNQLTVDHKDCDALRFFIAYCWLDNESTDHRMLVGLFSSTSSPGIANLCLREVADDFGEAFDAETMETVRRNFCVYDLLRSAGTEDAAVRLVTQVCSLLKKGGCKLTKRLSKLHCSSEYPCSKKI